MSKSKVTCFTCPSFQPMPEPGTEQAARGECRIKPPVVHMLIVPAPPQQGRVMNALPQGPAVVAQTVFPVVMVDAWCGMHPANIIGKLLSRVTE